MKNIKIDKKKVNVIITILLLLIPLLVSGYLRIQPDQLPLMDKQAEQNVQQFYKGRVQEQVDEKYAYLPPEKKKEMVNEQLSRLSEQGGERYQKEVERASEQMKSKLRDENGDTYLLAIDPWMQYQYTKNYLKTGHPGNEMIDGEPVNTLRGGRFAHGDGDSTRFHPWLMAKFHNFINIFKDTSVMKSVFLFPLIWVTLAVIPAFFIGRRLSNNLGGFISAMIVAVHSAIVSRTVAGFSDTDAHNVFFPLFILWFIIEALYTKSSRNKYIFGGLAGLFTGFYSMAWTGWWYPHDAIVGGLIGYLIVMAIKHRDKVKSCKGFYEKFKGSVNVLGSYIVSAFVFVGVAKTIVFGSAISFSKYFQAFLEPVDFINLKDVAITSIWPNVMTTVAELNPASIQKVMNTMGTPVIFLLSMLGIVFLTMPAGKMFRNDKYLLAGAGAWYLLVMAIKGSIGSILTFGFLVSFPVIVIAIYSMFYKTHLKLRDSFLLLLLFLGTFYAAVKGIRFSALFTPFFGILLGVAAARIYIRGSEWISKNLSINKVLTRTVVLILLLWIILPTPINAGHERAVHEIPSYNDAWDSTLSTINERSDPAIITSWWDFGHWFVAGSQRMVTFDGGNQGRRIHWVGKTLVTDSEKESVDILRMLNCGQNRAVEELEEEMEDYEAVKTVQEVISVDREEARKILEEKEVEDKDKVLEYTHCKDTYDQYMIASEDMIGKSGVWGHFGSWDFDRGFIYNRVNSMDEGEALEFLQEQNFSENEARRMYANIQSKDGDEWVAEWPSYASDQAGCRENNGTLACQNGLVYDLETRDAQVRSQQGTFTPVKLATEINGSFSVTEYDSGENYGAVLYKRNGNYRSILAQPEQTTSMFTRLFFFEGKGLDNYNLVSHETGIDGRDIYLYEVNLNGTQ
ncbi:MAG: STT3 domain-containing protein [Nanobdellota archaeon]